MAHFDDAKALVEHCEQTFSAVEAEYKASLSTRQVRKALLIKIKNLMENLRSALDFCAHGLFQKYGSTAKTGVKLYFPYAQLNQSAEVFRKKKGTALGIPGLESQPQIVAKIESYQHFAALSNRWLPVFMDLNNENKHQHLTPQTSNERKELRLSSGGAQVSLGQGARISLGRGASIRIGGMKIEGGQEVSTDQPARTSGEGTQELLTWVSFNFSTNNEPVLPLLSAAVQGVRRIVDELSTA